MATKCQHNGNKTKINVNWKDVVWSMFLALLRGLIVPRGKEIVKKTENTIFVMNLMWKVANSKEFGFQPLRQFTTKLRLFSD